MEVRYLPSAAVMEWIKIPFIVHSLALSLAQMCDFSIEKNIYNLIFTEQGPIFQIVEKD